MGRKRIAINFGTRNDMRQLNDIKKFSEEISTRVQLLCKFGTLAQQSPTKSCDVSVSDLLRHITFTHQISLCACCCALQLCFGNISWKSARGVQINSSEWGSPSENTICGSDICTIFLAG